MSSFISTVVSAAVQVPADLDAITPTAPTGGVANQINTLLGWGSWFALIAGVAGLLIAGIMMMIGRRNRSQMAADGAIGIPWVLGGISLVILAVPIVNLIA